MSLDFKLILDEFNRRFDEFEIRWDRRFSSAACIDLPPTPLSVNHSSSDASARAPPTPAAAVGAVVIADNWGGCFDGGIPEPPEGLDPPSPPATYAGITTAQALFSDGVEETTPCWPRLVGLSVESQQPLHEQEADAAHHPGLRQHSALQHLAVGHRSRPPDADVGEGARDSSVSSVHGDGGSALSHLAPIREAASRAHAPAALPKPREKIYCRLVDRTKLFRDVRLIRFSLPSPDQALGLPIGTHVFDCASVDGKPCMRAYTPTSKEDEVLTTAPNRCLMNCFNLIQSCFSWDAVSHQQPWPPPMLFEMQDMLTQYNSWAAVPLPNRVASIADLHTKEASPVRKLVAEIIGFSISVARLGLPGVGLISYEEMFDQGRLITEAVSIPVIGDADNGYGNCMNVKEDKSLAALSPTPRPVAKAAPVRSNSRAASSRKEDSVPVRGGGNTAQGPAQIFTFQKLAVATKKFRKDCLLGEGGFGRVYKGHMENGQVIAVEQLDRNGFQGIREFLVEVLMLSLLHHPNLVCLIGYCADGSCSTVEFNVVEHGVEVASDDPQRLKHVETSNAADQNEDSGFKIDEEGSFKPVLVSGDVAKDQTGVKTEVVVSDVAVQKKNVEDKHDGMIKATSLPTTALKAEGQFGADAELEDRECILNDLSVVEPEEFESPVVEDKHSRRLSCTGVTDSYKSASRKGGSHSMDRPAAVSWTYCSAPPPQAAASWPLSSVRPELLFSRLCSCRDSWCQSCCPSSVKDAQDLLVECSVEFINPLSSESNEVGSYKQSLLNYILLALVYGETWLYKQQPMTIRWYYYRILGIIDVEVNYIVVTAYQYTSLTSVILPDCWSIPCVIVFTWIFLKAKYGLRKFTGVGVWVAGLILVVFSVVHASERAKGPNSLTGDLLVIGGSMLHAFSKVTKEYFVQESTGAEVMAMLAAFRAIISGIHISILEQKELRSTHWTAGAILSFRRGSRQNPEETARVTQAMDEEVAAANSTVQVHGVFGWFLQFSWDPGGSNATHRLEGKPNVKKGGMSAVRHLNQELPQLKRHVWMGYRSRASE